MDGLGCTSKIMNHTVNQKVKPLLRGHFHQASFFIALGASAMLVATAHGLVPRLAGLVYGLSLSAMFGISSLYHRINWQPGIRDWWRRLDHAAIYVLIAGTGTPVSLLGIRGAAGDTMLWIFWGAAIAGVCKEFFFLRAPKWVSAFFFVVMGWAGVLYYGEMSAGLGPVGMGLMLGGGIVYTLGAVVYATKKPNPYPKVFGYHEIFHLMVTLASMLHFVVVYRLVTIPM
jgi:hemolysin III